MGGRGEGEKGEEKEGEREEKWVREGQNRQSESHIIYHHWLQQHNTTVEMETCYNSG